MGPIIDQVRHALIARSQRGPCPLLAWKLLDHTQPAVGEPQVAVVQAWSSLAAFEDFWQDLLSHGALAESTQAGNASFSMEPVQRGGTSTPRLCESPRPGGGSETHHSDGFDVEDRALPPSIHGALHPAKADGDSTVGSESSGTLGGEQSGRLATRSDTGVATHGTKQGCDGQVCRGSGDYRRGSVVGKAPPEVAVAAGASSLFESVASLNRSASLPEGCRRSGQLPSIVESPLSRVPSRKATRTGPVI